MKPNFTTTEDSLRNGKNISLSANEHATMKASLLSYATYHQPSTMTPSEKPLFSRGFALFTVSVATFVCVLTTYASTYSLPGESLYSLKVNAVEEIVGLTKLTPADQIAYRRDLYERRLGEIHQLNTETILSVDALTNIETELTELTSEITTILEENDTEISAVQIADITSDIVSATEAVHTLISNTTTETHTESFANLLEATQTIHEQSLDNLLESGTTTINTYLEEQLTELSNEISENDLDATTTTAVTDLIIEGQAALDTEDLETATTLVTEAVQTIKSEEYISDYQDEIAE